MNSKEQSARRWAPNDNQLHYGIDQAQRVWFEVR